MQKTLFRCLIAICGFFLVCSHPQWSYANDTSETLVLEGRTQLFNGGNLTVSGLLEARDTFADAVAADGTDQTAQAFYGFTHALAFLFEDGTTAQIETLKEMLEAFGVMRTANDGIDTELFSGLPTFDGRYNPPAALPNGGDVGTFVQDYGPGDR
jgi:hypothetical protein